MLKVSLILAAINQLVVFLHIYLMGFDITGKTHLTSPGYAQFYQNTLFPIQMAVDAVLILLIVIFALFFRKQKATIWHWLPFIFTFLLLFLRGF